MTRRPPIDLYVCRKCKGSEAFTAALVAEAAERREGHPRAAEVTVRLVRCQDICKGPVAGLAVDGEPTWFRRVRGGKPRRALVKLAARGGRGPVPERLGPHHVAKRDGRPPKR